MKSARSNGREPRRKSPADAARTQTECGSDRTRKRARSKPVDGRTRAAKRWRALRDHYFALAGPRHDQLDARWRMIRRERARTLRESCWRASEAARAEGDHRRARQLRLDALRARQLAEAEMGWRTLPHYW